MMMLGTVWTIQFACRATYADPWQLDALSMHVIVELPSMRMQWWTDLGKRSGAFLEELHRHFAHDKQLRVRNKRRV